VYTVFYQAVLEQVLEKDVHPAPAHSYFGDKTQEKAQISRIGGIPDGIASHMRGS